MRNPRPSTAVELTFAGPVAHVQLRGERGIQTLSSETRARLHTVLDELEQQAAIRVLVITGTGPTFIAGADIREFLELTPQSARELVTDGQRLMHRLASLPCITVAAMNGACVGGGLELALACDIRIAAQSAKIGFPETGLGIVPSWGGTVRATQQWGPSWASRLILTGELLSGEQAEQWGLVQASVPFKKWTLFLEQTTQRLLTHGPLAMQTAKQLIADCSQNVAAAEQGFAAEADSFVASVASGQLQHGVRAFLEKRTPDWSAFASPQSPDA